MKKGYLILIVLVSIVWVGNGQAFYTSERSDNLLDDNEDAIYMIGSAFNLLTSAKSESKSDLFTIYKINLKNDVKSVFLKDERKFMNRLTMSPNQDYIAVLRSNEYMKYEEITVINKKLKNIMQVIQEPDGIITYVWSPDSTKIAYMTGTIGERSKVSSKGIVVYDLETNEKRKITKSAMNIEWLPTGEFCLYDKYIEQKDGSKVRLYKTLVYNDMTGVIKEEKKGVNLSLDGRYSINPRYIGRSMDETYEVLVDFYDLKKGKAITGASLDKVFNEPLKIIWRPILWLKGNRIVVEKRIQSVLPLDISISDIENNMVLKEFRGRIVGVNSDRSKLVIYDGGKFRVEEVP